MQSINNKFIFSKEYYISAGDGNAEGNLAITRLTEMLIDIATEHANSLGIGNTDMKNINAGWVLSRLTIEMQSHPLVNDTIVIETWVEGWNRHFSERCFRIKNVNGTCHGYARSIWMVMTTDSHENYGLSHLSLPQGAIMEKIAPIQRQAKHCPILPIGSPQDPKSLIATSPDSFYTFKYCDLDFYRHVNTVKYVMILLNQFTLDQFDRNEIMRIELSFLHEGHYGMEVAVRRCDTSDKETSFLVLSTSDNQPLLYSRVSLRPRSPIFVNA